MGRSNPFSLTMVRILQDVVLAASGGRCSPEMLLEYFTGIAPHAVSNESVYTYKHKYIQTDRQTDRTNRQTDIYIYIYT